MILVSGVSSGLGFRLAKHFAAVKFDRSRPIEFYRDSAIDLVIHCAFNPQRDVGSASVRQYVEDNIFLTKQLASLKPKKFIFLSTVDIYPRNGKWHSEDEAVLLGDQDSAYGIAKFISESIVRDTVENSLILRPTGMVGDNIRRTTLLRLLLESRPALTLTRETILNFISHEIVEGFLDKANRLDLRGTFNIASSQNVTLGDLAMALNAEPTFGDVFYDIGMIDPAKAREIEPALQKTSLEIARAFADHVRATTSAN